MMTKTVVRKAGTFLAGMAVGAALVIGPTVLARTNMQQISVAFLPLRYYFDMVEKAPPQDQTGFIWNGRTYVPLRFVAESLGKTVNYDGANYSIYVGKQPAGTAGEWLDELPESRVLSSTGDWYKWKAGSMDNWGNSYQHAVGFDCESFDFFSRCNKKAREYILNAAYDSIDGLIMLDQSTKNTPKSLVLGIFVDDREVFRATIEKGVSPIPFNLNLRGAGRLKFAIIEDDGNIEDDISVGIGNALLHPAE